MSSTFVRGWFFTLLSLSSSQAFARTGHSSAGYQPAPALSSQCDCQSINGTCSNTCAGGCSPGCETIVCANGFFNCDGDFTNGCECGSNGVCDTASCPAAACVHAPKIGASCATDCLLGATCDSSGKCSGNNAPDHSPCVPPANCADSQGECGNGTCLCSHPIDMAASSADDLAQCSGPHCHPTPKGSCSLVLGATAPAGAWTLLLLIGLALLLRRRAA